MRSDNMKPTVDAIVLSDGEGDESGHVAGEEVASAGLELPVVALAQQMESGIDQLSLRFRGGMELSP